MTRSRDRLSVDDMAARVEAIASGIGAIAERLGRVEEDMTEVTSVAEITSAASEQVTATAQETSSAAVEMAGSAVELADTASELSRLVAAFTLRWHLTGGCAGESVGVCTTRSWSPTGRHRRRISWRRLSDARMSGRRRSRCSSPRRRRTGR